ncbi:aminobenzoate oxygenase [Rhodothalassium salexigens]|uniref:diiron oxygenase n=1 Tax=Rhodothalassium salexigens TaxID=1086 RepID=UPI0019128FBB|nr:diiron oxygenase [Rhodothalassium salexigens]MBK5909895.1 aminobenzoate oxygenase [Rhodothalassium salexigens]MBK5922024.1 aminobenzoate oxygenase [Rhodothalassium salexigens]
MTLTDSYLTPPDEARWVVDEDFAAVFDWTYGGDRADMLALYTKGKRRQWDAETRIDWHRELDPDNPQEIPDQFFPLAGSDIYERMTPAEKREARRHYQAWTNCQFLHGEQGALFCAAKIVQQVPDMDAKFYAATQTIDEARHVEAYEKLIAKFGLAYEMSPPLKSLLDQVLRDRRWDMTYLGMQVVIEGLALAAFAMIRDHAQNPLARQVNAYVMQDEARHVAFGRLALRDYYPQLTQAERDEREEFLVEACYLMRDRFQAREVWECLGLDADACVEWQEQSQGMQMFRANLFSRIVPVVKDIGLWGERVQGAYRDMGVLGFAATDIDAQQAEDERVAQELEARRAYVDQVVTLGAEDMPAAE